MLSSFGAIQALALCNAVCEMLKVLPSDQVMLALMILVCKVLAVREPAGC